MSIFFLAHPVYSLLVLMIALTTATLILVLQCLENYGGIMVVVSCV